MKERKSKQARKDSVERDGANASDGLTSAFHSQIARSKLDMANSSRDGDSILYVDMTQLKIELFERRAEKVDLELVLLDQGLDNFDESFDLEYEALSDEEFDEQVRYDGGSDGPFGEDYDPDSNCCQLSDDEFNEVGEEDEYRDFSDS